MFCNYNFCMSYDKRIYESKITVIQYRNEFGRSFSFQLLIPLLFFTLLAFS